jgi:subtilisin family serine protease
MSNTHGDSESSLPRSERPWYDDALPNDRQRARYRGQVERIRDGLTADLNSPDRPGWASPTSDGRTIVIDAYPAGVDDLADALFLYRTDTLIVAPRDLADVQAALERRGLRSDLDDRVPADLDLAVLLLARDDRAGAGSEGGRSPSPVEQALAALDDEWRASREAAGLDLWSVSYDRVIHVSTASACPADDPSPVGSPDPLPPVATDPNLGSGVKVVVVDTALPVTVRGGELPNPKYWLEHVTGDPEIGVTKGEYHGHGMFVAGVLRAMAPAATVHVAPLIFSSGGVLESDFAIRLRDVLVERAPQIVNLSAGTFAGPGDTVTPPFLHGQALVTYDSVHQMMDASGCLLVCAAGNNGDTEPFVPASTGWPVAVGALDAYGRRARYSNHGTYVDVYARGSDILNAYPQGLWPVEGVPIDFIHGMARWSGTSFATPIVAGLIAARKSWSGESVQDAWASLKGIAIANNVGGRPVLGPGDADRP